MARYLSATTGLLEAALARPQASVAGQDAYPTLDHKAAAPLHSQARNHPLVDGNKRLALAGTYCVLRHEWPETDPDQ
ncbi:MAG: type II toxin-antitoxin system death-on-curing family toxin [Nocardioidaceae bacterium]